MIDILYAHMSCWALTAIMEDCSHCNPCILDSSKSSGCWFSFVESELLYTYYAHMNMYYTASRAPMLCAGHP